MATATAKTKPKAATKTPTSTKAPEKATAWRYEVLCEGKSITEHPVTQAQMLGQLKNLTTSMANAKNGRAKITIECSLPGAGK
jgi:hypothetical protein